MTHNQNFNLYSTLFWCLYKHYRLWCDLTFSTYVVANLKQHSFLETVLLTLPASEIESHLAWSKCSLWYVTSFSPHLWPLWSLVLKWWIVWNLLIELNFQAYKIFVNVGRYAWPIFINSCRTPQGFGVRTQYFSLCTMWCHIVKALFVWHLKHNYYYADGCKEHLVLSTYGYLSTI